MIITKKEIWEEYGGLIIAMAIIILITALITAIAITIKPDYYIYEFQTTDGIITFEVSTLIDSDYTSYTFLLTDGRKVIYYPEKGTILNITEVKK